MDFPDVDSMEGCISQCLLHPEATALQFNDDGWCGCMTMGDSIAFDDAIAEATHLGPWTTCTICDLSAMCFYEMCHNDGHWVEIDFPDASDMADCRDQCIATNQATSFQYNDGGWCGCMILDGVEFEDAIGEATHLGPWTTCTICDISNAAGLVGGGGSAEPIDTDVWCEIDGGMLEDHWDDGMYQDVTECSALCDSFDDCNFFLHGLDSRTGLNRCRAQRDCQNPRSYGFGGGVNLYARGAGSGGGDSGDGVYIVESRQTIDNAAYDILTLDFEQNMFVNNMLNDGILSPIGGACHGACADCTGIANRNNDNRCPAPQHDEVISSQLSGTCDTSSWKVYGRNVGDESKPVNQRTDLRHIRVAYSMDGTSWECYTQSDTPTQGGTASLASASTNCNEGPSHAASGAVFNINAPAKFVSMAFWGLTEIWEIELIDCGGEAPGRAPPSCMAPLVRAGALNDLPGEVGGGWDAGSDSMGDYITQGGTGSFLRWENDFGTDDWTSTMSIVATNLDGSAATFEFNQNSTHSGRFCIIRQ